MADTWDEGTAGLLLSDAPPLIAETPVKDEKADKPPGRSKKSKDTRTLRPAADKPVARIAVDLPLAPQRAQRVRRCRPLADPSGRTE